MNDDKNEDSSSSQKMQDQQNSPQPDTSSSLPPLDKVEETKWFQILQWSPLASFIIGGPGLFNVILPAIIWYMYKDRSGKINNEGKDLLNLQMSLALYAWIAWVLATVLSILIVPLALPFIVGVVWLVVTIMNALKAIKGEKLISLPGMFKFIK